MDQNRELMWMPIVWRKTDLEGGGIPHTFFVIKVPDVGQYAATIRLFIDRDTEHEEVVDRRDFMTAAEVCDGEHIDPKDSSEKIRIEGTHFWLVNRCEVPLEAWLPARLRSVFARRVEEAIVRREMLRLGSAGEA